MAIMTENTGPDQGLTRHFLHRLKAAEHAGVHPRTIDRWMREKKLTRYQRLNKVFVDVRELDELTRIHLV